MLNFEMLIVIGVALVLVLGLTAVQKVREERRKRREQRLGIDQESGVLVRGGAREDADKSRVDSGFERMVQRAGVEASPEELVGIMLLLGVLIGGGLYLWREDLILALGGFLLGVAIPFVILLFMQGRYRAKLQVQLPDALYLIARSLRAGTSMEQAIDMVGTDGPKPLADEFKRCAGSMQLGLPAASALQLMADRVNLLDFNAFVSSVKFHQTTGGNLPLILDRLAASVRDRNQFRGQFWAATSLARITALVLALAGPLIALGYLVIQPEFGQALFRTPQGWGFLAIVAGLELIGIIWISRILKIDY